MIVEKLPLYPDPSYFYEVSLQGRTYRLEFNFIERTQSWTMNIFNSDGEALLTGKRVVTRYPMTIHHNLPFSGVFYFEPVGVLENYTLEEKIRLDKYFNLYFIYDEEDG